MIRRTLTILSLVLALPLALLFVNPTAYAQVERFVDGTHYVTLDVPVNTRDSSKIEVIEAFWYGCTHCFRFEPLVEDWKANAPADVDFMRFPAMWNGLMKIHAQIYYAAEALDALEIVHEPVFNAINLEGNRLQNERQIGDLFERHGIDREEFSRAFNSFGVRTRVNQAESRMQDYRIQSTPNMIVNGKYLIATGPDVPTQQMMLDIVDFLIARERAAL